MANDGDIHFPPGQRREKPSFEPPPWERDQFEELARQKREAEPEPPQLEVEPPPGERISAAASDNAEDFGKDEQTRAEEAAEGTTEAENGKPELDPKHVELLMMGLRTEEPRPEEAYWKISIFAGVVSALIGLAVTTWGVVALATPKQPGAGPFLLVTMLLLFGIGFIVGGVWVIFRSLRQQGVL